MTLVQNDSCTTLHLFYVLNLLWALCLFKSILNFLKVDEISKKLIAKITHEHAKHKKKVLFKWNIWKLCSIILKMSRDQIVLIVLTFSDFLKFDLIIFSYSWKLHYIFLYRYIHLYILKWHLFKCFILE